MANNANTVLTTNFNISPYYDDYNGDKGFYRVLFKPGFAVQARELTQLQTIMQEQVTRFGKHMFRDGSIVLPGSFDSETHGGQNQGYGIPFVKIKDTNSTGGTFTLRNFIGQTLTGATNGVKAKVIDVLDGTQNSVNTKTLYLRYISGGSSNNQIKLFAPNEVLTSSIGNVVANNSTVASTTGYGSRFTINSGVLFAKNHFIKFPKQSIVISRYNPNPTAQIGFLLNEEIVQSDDDTTLLDPAMESSNYSAPGADRFKIGTQLIVSSATAEIQSPDYVPLITYENGIVIQSFERSQYNILRDELAKRTFDESGDYIVKGLQAQLMEHEKTSVNGGRYIGGNNKLLLATVAPGTGYVQGYEIENRDTIEIPVRKGLDTSNDRGQSASTSMGSYVVVNELVGSWELNKGNIVNLRNAAQTRISGNKWSGGTVAAGSVIGTARLMSLVYSNGVQGYDATYYAYLADIKMTGSESFSSVKSIQAANSPHADLYADLVLENGRAALKGTDGAALLYYAGSNAIKNVRDADNLAVSATSFNYLRTEGITSSLTVSTSGVFSTTAVSGNESIPYGTSASLSALDKREITLTFIADTTVTIPGVVTGTAGTKIINGDLSSLFNKLNVGDKVTISGRATVFYVTDKISATSIEVNTALPAGVTGNTLTKVYRAGDIIDLTTIGYTDNQEREVSSTSTTLTFDLHETFPSAVPITVTYPVKKSSALELPKILKPSRYLKINCNISGVNGPYNLGFSDVLRIKKVVKKTNSYPTSGTDGTDVTSQFILNNGQKDTHYDHASLTPRNPLAATDRLLVELDYFDPNISSSASGFFTIDSYPIQDDAELETDSTIRTEEIPIFRSPVTGKSFNLRNHLDFRPVRSRTAADATTIAGATESHNLASSTNTGFATPSGGLRLPQPSSDLVFDYHYYLGRVDIVVVDKNYNFTVQEGRASIGPTAPKPMPGRMVIATLDIPPYPSLSSFYATRINRRDLSVSVNNIAITRFTMRDISILRDRINNLEYYNTLNLLEKNAADFSVKDVNGLDRFKNGIFVDTFKDNTLSVNPDQFVVDDVEQSIRPKFTTESIPYVFLSGSGVVKRDDLIMLSYTEMLFLNQPSVTSDLNIERTSYLFIGTLKLIPEQDIWIDTKILPDEQIQMPPAYIPTPPDDDNLRFKGQNVNTTWGATQKIVTGYSIFDANGKQVGRNYTAAELAQARAFAQQTANDLGSARLETQYNDVSQGTVIKTASDTATGIVGYSIRDTKVIPYMRPVTVYVRGTGLKPNTQVWCYFDNVPVSNTCTPLSKSEYTTLSAVVKTNDSTYTAAAAKEGTPLVADRFGVVYYRMRLPVGTTANTYNFRTGEKSVVLIDSRVAVDDELIDESPDVTTGARGMFIADGQSVTKQRTILSTRRIYTWPEPTVKVVPKTENEGFVRPPPPFPWWLFLGSCIAYSFKAVAPLAEEGIFITSAEIYISRKSAVNGMWFEIREMSSDGNLTRTQVPFSEISFDDPDELPLSTDGKTNGLRITFEAPVFLYHDTEYAFVIHSINADPDTYVWVSKLGERDINTNTQKTSRAYSGTLYGTNNNLNWDIITDTDLTVKLYRAEFTENSTGTATLGTANTEKLILSSVSKNFSTQGGNYFSTGDKLTLSSSNTFGGVGIVVGDKLRGNQSGAIASVINITGGRYITNANVAYRTGERVDALYSSNNVYKKVSGVIGKIDNGYAILDSFTQAPTYALATFKNSNGDFRVGDIVRCNDDSSMYGYIHSAENFRYSAAMFRPEYLDFHLTSMTFSMQPTSNTGTVGSYFSVDPNELFTFNTEQAVFSRSDEILAPFNGSKTNKIQVAMRTSSNVLSPVVDISKTHTIFYDNFISDDVTDETLPQNGKMINRYVSKTVTLAEGQDAEDIKVILTSYRPPGTDVRVWVKILNGDDSAGFFERPWIELNKTTGEYQYSALANKDDFREIQYGFPTSLMTGTNGSVKYTNAATGTVYEGYKHFAIKIGLVLQPGVTNTAVVPRVSDLRVLALQM